MEITYTIVKPRFVLEPIERIATPISFVTLLICLSDDTSSLLRYTSSIRVLRGN